MKTFCLLFMLAIFSVSCHGQAAGGPTGTGISAGSAPAALSITTASPLPGGNQNVAYSTTLAATGGVPGYTWAITVGTLPTGLSLGASTGIISGTPTGSGTSNFTIQVTDSVASTSSTAFALTISAAANPPSITTSSPLPNGTQNTAYSTTLAATGGTVPYSWSVTAGTLPTGLSLVAGTGVISGTPTGTGTSNFTVTVTDNVAATGSKAFALTINAQQSGSNVTTCGVILGTASTLYTLQNDISATDTCLQIQADNVSLNLNNFNITFGTNPGSTQVYGILACNHASDSNCPTGSTGTFKNPVIYGCSTPPCTAGKAKIGMDPIGAIALSDSNNIRIGGGSNVPGSIHDLTLETWGTNTIPLFIRYDNGTPGWSEYNLTINDYTSGAINRSAFKGMALKHENSFSTPGSAIHDSTVAGWAPQGGIFTSNYTSRVNNNDVNFIGQFSNDFGVVAYGQSIEVDHNNIHPVSGRGIFSSGACFTSPCTVASGNIRGMYQLIHDNTVDVTEAGMNCGDAATPPPAVRSNVSITQGGNTVTGFTGLATGYTSSYWVYINNEVHAVVSNTATSVTISGTWALATGTTYTMAIRCGGCGSFAFGTYGIQHDDNSANNTIYNNTVTAHDKLNANGTKCAASALRLSTFNSGNLSHDNTYIQQNDTGADGYDAAGNDLKGGALSIESSGVGFVYNSLRDTFTGDNASIMFEDLGLNGTGAGFTCQSCTLGKGTNPRAGGKPYQTFHFYSYRNTNNPPGGSVINDHFIDTTFTGGASKTSTDLFASTAYMEYFIDWTYTVTVTRTSNGTPVSGASVTITSNQDGATPVTECTLTTNASGVASCVLTELHPHNTSSSVLMTSWNPHAVTISAAGCTTLGYNLTIAATTNEGRVLGGC